MVLELAPHTVKGGGLAPGASIRCVYARLGNKFPVVSYEGEDEDHTEMTPEAVAVVAPVRCAENGSCWGSALEGRRGHRETLLGARDWLPQKQLVGTLVLGEEEGAAVAAVEGLPGCVVRSGEVEERGGSRDEAGDMPVMPIVEEAVHGGRPVDISEAAAEGGVGESAAPRLVYGGGAEDADRVVLREAEENFFDELARERRQRCHLWSRYER